MELDAGEISRLSAMVEDGELAIEESDNDTQVLRARSSWGDCCCCLRRRLLRITMKRRLSAARRAAMPSAKPIIMAGSTGLSEASIALSSRLTWRSLGLGLTIVILGIARCL